MEHAIGEAVVGLFFGICVLTVMFGLYWFFN